MQRDPSIHIKLSDLVHILKTKVFDKNLKPADLGMVLLKECAPYSVSTRSVISSNLRVERKAKKLIHSSRLDSDLFSQLIYATRKSLKHRGITLIKPGSKDWDMVKEITTKALDFCLEFELGKREGFIQYIKIGISKMIKFNLNKFNGLHEIICETYSAIKEIEKDTDPELTKELYNYYSQEVIRVTGIFEPIDNDPEKYVYFVKARQLAEELNVSLDLYIEAQFDGLNFAKGIPHPVQLTGVNARQRLIRYLYKKGFKVVDKN